MSAFSLPRTSPISNGSPLDTGSAASARVPDEIRRAADGFESLFAAQLLEPIEKSASHLFGSGPEGRTIGGLFREQLATAVASARPLGIANMIENELLARQGWLQAPASGGAVRRAVAAYGKASR